MKSQLAMEVGSSVCNLRMSPLLALSRNWPRQPWQDAFQLLEDEPLHVLGAMLQVGDSKGDSGVNHNGRPDFGGLYIAFLIINGDEAYARITGDVLPSPRDINLRASFIKEAQSVARGVAHRLQLPPLAFTN